MKFLPGYKAGWTEEERLFALKIVNYAKPHLSKFADIEKRMFKRLIMRFMGEELHRFPLYLPKECPVCEREIAGKVFDRHVKLCKEKDRSARRIPKVDLSILEML